MIKLTNNEKKGINLTVKGLAKKYPFVKGWDYNEESDDYTYSFYINLLIDPIESINFIREKYGIEFYPSRTLIDMVTKRPDEYETPVLMLYSSVEGEGGEMMGSSNEAWSDTFNKLYDIKLEMVERLNDKYNMLPDEYKIPKALSLQRYRITPEKK